MSDLALLCVFSLGMQEMSQSYQLKSGFLIDKILESGVQTFLFFWMGGRGKGHPSATGVTYVSVKKKIGSNC